MILLYIIKRPLLPGEKIRPWWQRLDYIVKPGLRWKLGKWIYQKLEIPYSHCPPAVYWGEWFKTKSGELLGLLKKIRRQGE